MKKYYSGFIFFILLTSCSNSGGYNFTLTARYSAIKSGAEISAISNGFVSAGQDIGTGGCFAKLWEREHPTDTIFLYSSEGKFDSIILRDTLRGTGTYPLPEFFLFDFLDSLTNLPLEKNEIQEMQDAIFKLEMGQKAALYPGQTKWIKVGKIQSFIP